MAGEEPNIGKEFRQMPAEPLLPSRKGSSDGVSALGRCCLSFWFGPPESIVSVKHYAARPYGTKRV